MDYMFQDGFLGTRAPFFMDFVMIIVALLPLLVMGAISIAKVKAYRLHAMVQNIIFVISFIVVGYFEYGVRAGGGFESFMQESHTSHSYFIYVLIFHIAVAVISLVIWVRTLWLSRGATNNNNLPGNYSQIHKRAGQLTFFAIFMTAFTGMWVYILLFVY